MKIYINNEPFIMTSNLSQILTKNEDIQIDLLDNIKIWCDREAFTRAIYKLDAGLNLTLIDTFQLKNVKIGESFILLNTSDDKNIPIETSLMDKFNKNLIEDNNINISSRSLNKILRYLYNPYYKLPEEYLLDLSRLIKDGIMDTGCTSQDITHHKSHIIEQGGHFPFNHMPSLPYNKESNIGDYFTNNPMVTFHRNVTRRHTNVKILYATLPKSSIEPSIDKKSYKYKWKLSTNYMRSNNMNVIELINIKHNIDEDFTKKIKKIKCYMQNDKINGMLQGIDNNWEACYQTLVKQNIPADNFKPIKLENKYTDVGYKEMFNWSGKALYVINHLLGRERINGQTNIYNGVYAQYCLNKTSYYDYFIELELFEECDIELTIKCRCVLNNELTYYSQTQTIDDSIFIINELETSKPKNILNEIDSIKNMNSKYIYVEGIVNIFSPENTNSPQNIITNFNSNMWKAYLKDADDNIIDKFDKNINHDLQKNMFSIPNAPVYLSTYNILGMFDKQPSGHINVPKDAYFEIEQNVKGKTNILLIQRDVWITLNKNDYYFVLSSCYEEPLINYLKKYFSIWNKMLEHYTYITPSDFIPIKIEDEICAITLNVINSDELYYKCLKCCKFFDAIAFDKWCKTCTKNKIGKKKIPTCPHCRSLSFPLHFNINSDNNDVDSELLFNNNFPDADSEEDENTYDDVNLFSEGNNSEGNNSEGNNSEGNNSEGNNSEGNNSEGNNSEGNNSEGNNSEGNNSEGNNSEGNNSEGNNSEGNNSEGNNSEGNPILHVI